MTDSRTAAPRNASVPSWSNRILIAVVAGIFFLTLYPFRFSLVRHGPPFLLAGWGKDAGPIDVFLNILLFVPFGFGFAESLGERGKSRAAVLGIALLAGALFSYSVEILQFYIPMRDSGWGDVVTNSIGSVLGFIVYEFRGAAILRFASRMELALVTRLSRRWLVVLLVFYVGIWLAAAIHFQRQARISDWDSNSVLLIGGSAAGEPTSAWNGKVFRVDFWSRALPDRIARAITAGSPQEIPAPLASYDLAGPLPFQDQHGVLPALVWVHDSSASAPPVVGTSWLMSRAPVSTFVNQVERANSFSFRVLCQPAPVPRNRRVVVIAQRLDSLDLELSQKGSSLIFWFRNPLSAKRPRLAWDVPDVFVPDQPRNLLLSYDGSRLTLYVDGKEEGRPYRLDPGTGLALFVHRIKSGELEGYHYLFYATVFLPVGCLLGLGWRNVASQAGSRLLIAVLGIVILPVLFEIGLAFGGGIPAAFGNIVLSAVLVLVGALWINADGQPENGSSAALA